MGKYMRKGKVSGEVAVMEVASHLGVLTRTRARSLLALQNTNKNPSSSASASASASASTTAAAAATSSACYLQLRSRRLEKASPAPRPPKDTPNPSAGPGSNRFPKRRDEDKKKGEPQPSPEPDGGAEVSFGENVLDVEARDRDARETTPCSLIRDPETIRTPGSTTRPTNPAPAGRRTQNSMRRNIPTAHEMEEFFAGAEQLQQRIFTEKYNFDPVNDHPLPGRYEWVKLDS